MSYEGYRQYWCPSGHQWEGPGEVFNIGDQDHLCDDCGQEAVFVNEVDDTNCDEWGRITPVLATPAVYKTCDMGFKHRVTPPAYLIPTEAQRNYAHEHGLWVPGVEDQCTSTS